MDGHRAAGRLPIPTVALAGLLGGAAVILAAVFPASLTHALPASLAHVGSPAAISMWKEGAGVPLAAAALLLAALSLRAVARGGFSWAGLWVGGLALLNAVALAFDDDFSDVGWAVYALGLGSLLVLAAWIVWFRAARPEPEGLGPLSSLPARVREARAPPPPPGERDRRLRLSSPAVWSLALYAALAAAYWGWPVRYELGSSLIASNTVDPSAFLWFYAWWPHALVHALNPFVTGAIFVPDGYNLTWVTAVPGPSLLMAPVTLALGPVATFNLLALAGPAVAAWTAFLLCRRVSGATAPALVGGYLFGFSPYMLRMLEGTPSLYLVALVPLAVLLVVWRIDGAIGERTFVAALACVVALQYLTSLDVLATSSLFGTMALAVAFLVWKERRPLILRTSLAVAAAYAGAVLLLAPVLYFMLFRPHTAPVNTALFAGDLESWILPGSSLQFGDGRGPIGPEGYIGGLDYFGVPLLVALLAFAWSGRRSRRTLLLAACFLVPAVASLGSLLRVSGNLTGVGLPWAAFAHFPGLERLVPQRFALYAFLAAGVAVAVWLAGRPGRVGWGLALLCVVAVIPHLGDAVWKVPISDPELIATSAYTEQIGSGDRVFTIARLSAAMRWQATEDYPFLLAGGYVGPFPDGYADDPAFTPLTSGAPPPSVPELRRFLRDKGVTVVLVDKAQMDPRWLPTLSGLGVPPRDSGGMLLYRVSDG